MLKNYLVTTLRNLWKYKGHTFINILGLAIGMASFILITLYVYHELAYDRYHQKADRIYRVVENLRTENELIRCAITAPPMGPAFAREFPEVEGFARFWPRKAVVRKDAKKFYEKECYLADSSVFDIFSFPLLEGDPQTALVAPRSVVLTETTAKKYFGEEDPLGQTLVIDEDNYKVTGVMADIPETSHFRFNLLISLITFTAEHRGAEEHAWFWNDFYTYLLLTPGENQIEHLKAKIPHFIEKYTGSMAQDLNMYYEELPLQSLTSIYLETPRTKENGIRGSKSNLYILSIIALFILLIACFNYVNLATARASRRMKEVGLRKVLGAERKALIQQFLSESVLVSFLSMLVGMLMAILLLPLFNQLLETSLNFGLISNGLVGLVLLEVCILIGILAGSYPAFMVSGFHPLLIFKNSPESLQGNVWLRKMLVAGQFIISITLIVGTLLVFDQLTLLHNIKLGFDKEKVLKINYNGNREVNQHLTSIKNALRNVAGVSGVSGANSVPGDPPINLYSVVEMEEGKMSETNINTFVIDHDFIPNYNIQVIAGRAFSRDFPADDSAAFMINEAAMKNFGWHSPEMAIGRKVDQQGKQGTIIGVVRDFHYKSLHHAVEPLLIHINPNWSKILSVKIASDDIPAVVAALEKQWKSLAPDLPFVYSFLDQDYDYLYKAEDQLSRVVSVFSGLTIFIACLGLLGLTAFAVERRFKEIGIRKVLGASVSQVIFLISKEFFILIIVAFFIAIPITYYGISLWLENFTDRITIHPSTFVLAGLATLAIAWLTISYLSIKAAMGNPVNALRDE